MICGDWTPKQRRETEITTINGIKIYIHHTSYGGEYAERYVRMRVTTPTKVYESVKLFLVGDRTLRLDNITITVSTFSSQRLPRFKVCVSEPEPAKIDNISVERWEEVDDPTNNLYGVVLNIITGISLNPEWIPIKIKWGSYSTETISMPPGTTESYGNMLPAGKHNICAEIEG